MKNSTYSYTYNIELVIQHPTRDLSSLVDELSKIPLSKVGKCLSDEMIKNKFTPDFANQKATRISFGFEFGWLNAMINDDLPTAVESIVDAVYPYKALLMELINDGGFLTMQIGWFITSNVGTGFSAELLKKLSDLKIPLDFFVYVSDEQRTINNQRGERVAKKIRSILHKYDPSGIVDKSAPLSESHYDPYQDLLDSLLPYIKAHASKEILAQELKEELGYFKRTNTQQLSQFRDYESIAAEISLLEWE